MLIPFELPPGVRRVGTRYQCSGRWWETQLVRFLDGAIRPFGGWKKKSQQQMDGPCRGMLAWKPTSYQRTAGIGTVNKFYILDDNDLIDVTPVDFPEGTEDSFAGPGFGLGDFGAGPFGIDEGGGGFEATIWSLDTWGDHLVALASHTGVIYEYRNDGARMEPVANAPTARAIFTTEEGILVALGADGDGRLGRWSDLRDNTVWDAGPGNAAGDWRFQTTGSLITGRRVRGGNIVLTTTDAHLMEFTGSQGVFSIRQIEQDCGLLAPNAVQGTAGGGAIWMGRENFHLYSGGRVQPVPCDLRDYIFRDINLFQTRKFTSGRISKYGEILFFYCSADSQEVNRCVSWNEREGHWTIVDASGIMPRGGWADAGAFALPLAGGLDGYVYEQENEWDADGEPLISARYLMSGPVELGKGDRILELSQMIPDDEVFGGLQIHFVQQFAPEDDISYRGPYEVTRPYTDIRVTARQVLVRLEALADEDFRFGTQRFEASAGGER